jgi:predicted nucleic acid-binding protein
MRTDAFFDSNVVLYLFGPHSDKAVRSERLLADGGVVNVQVLNEIANVALRKMRKPWIQAREMLNGIRANCSVVSVTIETHERGLAIAERYQLQLYDGMIVAAAQLAGCTVLYSEDMRDGLVIDRLTIRNPFAASA